MPNLGLTKTWSYLAATTTEAIAPIISDNVTSRIFLLHQLDKKGRKEYRQGGLKLVFPVMKELRSAQFYDDLDTLTTSRANPTTVALYEWKKATIPVQVSGTDMIINSGSDQAQIDALTHFVEVAIAELREGLAGSANGIFSSNDETGAGITGLQNMITHTANAAPTTGTAGNLSRADYSVWSNQVVDLASAFSTNGNRGMHNLYLQCTRGDESPDIICLTRATYLNYIALLTGTFSHRIPHLSDQGMLDAGVPNVTFNQAVVGFDDFTPTDNGYFLNSKYVHWVVHPGRDIEIGPVIIPDNQDAITAHIYWAGNLCISNMARQGLLRRGDTN